jgi:hypothetical protein
VSALRPLSPRAEWLLLECAQDTCRPEDQGAARELENAGLGEWERGIGGGQVFGATPEGKTLAIEVGERQVSAAWSAMLSKRGES